MNLSEIYFFADFEHTTPLVSRLPSPGKVRNSGAHSDPQICRSEVVRTCGGVNGNNIQKPVCGSTVKSSLDHDKSNPLDSGTPYLKSYNFSPLSELRYFSESLICINAIEII
jgi:hypothetical protein